MKGFSLLELLLVITALVALFTVVTWTLDPLGLFRRFEDADRESDLVNLENALYSYFQDNRGYPENLTNNFQEICDSNSNPTDCTDISVLTPEYLREIPQDDSLDNGTGYLVKIHSDNSFPTLCAREAALGPIFVNPEQEPGNSYPCQEE